MIDDPIVTAARALLATLAAEGVDIPETRALAATLASARCEMIPTITIITPPDTDLDEWLQSRRHPGKIEVR